MKTLRLACAFLVPMLPGTSCFSQSEATSEAELSFKKADAEMNCVYEAVKAKLADKRQKADLIKAQEAWLKFRDADAAFRAGVTGGGSAYSMDYPADLAELTEARTKDLTEFVKRLR